MLTVVVLAAAFALAGSSLETDWKNYKQKYNKVYSGNEDSLRHFIFQTNMNKIQEHNELYALGKSSFKMGENQFADWTREEFVRNMNGLKVHVKLDWINKEEEKVFQIPKSVDWREKGYVTPVKYQGYCGSCWAFSATGAMEGQHFASTGKLVSLSESNLVDCSIKFNNSGCDGGEYENAFRYVIANKGIDTEASYPYKPYGRHCEFKKSNVGATFSSFTNLKAGSEAALQQAIAKIGPISVGIDASQSSFQFYHSGVYDEKNCNATNLDHAVLAVGYNITEDGKEYYIVKNSWSHVWGINGYIWMSRNKNNQCGIATEASYPIV